MTKHVGHGQSIVSSKQPQTLLSKAKQAKALEMAENSWRVPNKQCNEETSVLGTPRFSSGELVLSNAQGKEIDKLCCLKLRIESICMKAFVDRVITRPYKIHMSS